MKNYWLDKIKEKNNKKLLEEANSKDIWETYDISLWPTYGSSDPKSSKSDSSKKPSVSWAVYQDPCLPFDRWYTIDGMPITITSTPYSEDEGYFSKKFCEALSFPKEVYEGKAKL